VSDVKPVSLSMNARRLLVVEKRRLTVFVVGEPRKASKSSATIPLPGKWEAEHALETAFGTFVVCGRAAGKPGVMEVNRRGDVRRVCGRQCTGVPCYLSTFDPDEADLLVADSSTHRVVLLSSQLEVVRVFLDRERDGVARPRRVVKAGYFLVGHGDDSGSGVVSLFWPRKSTLLPIPETPTSDQMIGL